MKTRKIRKRQLGAIWTESGERRNDPSAGFAQVYIDLGAHGLVILPCFTTMAFFTEHPHETIKET